MGAVSLPVYADDLSYDNTYYPAQVEITIANSNVATNGGNSQGTGQVKNQDDVRHKYDYLENIDKATVKMYRVATLDGSGWHWNSTINTALQTAGDDDKNGVKVENDFEKLLARVVQNNGEDSATNPYVDTDNHNDPNSYPKMTSDELQALASKLERIIVNNPSAGTFIASDTVTKNADGTFTTAYLPTDADVYQTGLTRDIKGYYLIVTETEESGVIFQPVLVELQNTPKTTTDDATQTAAAKSSVKALSLKGTNISIDKSIEDVTAKVDADGKQIKKDGDLDKTYRERGAIAGSEDSAIVSKNDFIKYQIRAELPAYDKHLTSTQIKPFTITDTPDQGIKIIGKLDTNGEYTGVTTTGDGDANKNTKILVYYSENDELVTSGTNSDILLKEGVDYKITKNDGVGASKTDDGFTVEFTGLQLRGEKTETVSEVTRIVANDASALHTDGNNVTTMEKGNIFVVFEATVDETLNRAYTASIALADVTPENAHTLDTDLTAPAYPTPADPENPTSEETTAIENYNTQKKAYDALKEKYDAVKAADYTALSSATEGPWKTVKDDTSMDETAKADLYKKAVLYMQQQNEIIAANNGNQNTATMNYANRYSTGKGDVSSSDTTTVYSVDLNLTKVVEDHLIEDVTGEGTTTDKRLYVTEVKAGTTSELTTAGKTQLQDSTNAPLYLKAGSAYETTATRSEAEGYDDAETEDANDTTVKRVYEVVTSTDEGDRVEVVASSGSYWTVKSGETNVVSAIAGDATTGFATQSVTTPGTLTGYKDKGDTEMKVKDAVFKLSHVYTANTYNGTAAAANADGFVIDGLAVSTDDGSLKLLTRKTVAATSGIPAADKEKVKYQQEITVNDVKTIEYWILEDNAADAWKELTIGTYKLEEVYAPTGFKKWATPVEFKIEAKTDALGAENDEAKWTTYTGTATNFTGEIRGYSDNLTAFDDADGTADTRAYFTFTSPLTTTVNGKSVTYAELQNKIKNEYDDKLPATGGIGTVLFTAGGISVVLIAGALFVMYMKKRNSEDEE